jgi:hypothetical protein
MKNCDICKDDFSKKKRKKIRIEIYDVETRKINIKTVNGDFHGKCAQDVVTRILNTDWAEELTPDLPQA